MFKKKIDQALPVPQRLLTAAEVTRLLHISRSLLYHLIQHGDLPALHIGHALRFRSEDLQAYIQEQSSVVRLRPTLHVKRQVPRRPRRRR